MKPAQRAANALLRLEQDLVSSTPPRLGRPGRAPRARTKGPARVVAYLREGQRTELFAAAERQGVPVSEIIHDALLACGVISR